MKSDAYGRKDMYAMSCCQVARPCSKGFRFEGTTKEQWLGQLTTDAVDLKVTEGPNKSQSEEPAAPAQKTDGADLFSYGKTRASFLSWSVLPLRGGWPSAKLRKIHAAADTGFKGRGGGGRGE